MIGRETVIVGGGITGMVVAALLQKAGQSPALLEKASDLGGRLAARFMGDVRVNLGYSPLTETEHSRLLTLFPALAPCFEKTPVGWRWHGSGGIGLAAQHLLEGVDVFRGTTVARLSLGGTGHYWDFLCAGDRRVRCFRLVLALPAAAALELVEVSFPRQFTHLKTLLRQVHYRPALVVSGRDRAPCEAPTHGAEIPSSEIARVFRAGEGVAVCFSDGFSRRYWNEEEAVVLERGRRLIWEQLGIGLQGMELKRWRFAMPEKLLSQPFLRAEFVPDIFFAGDYFEPGGFLGALDSAEALVKSLLEQPRPARPPLPRPLHPS